MKPPGRQSVADMALQDDVLAAAEPQSRARALGRLRLGDTIFRISTRVAAITVLVVLAGVILALIKGSIPALQAFGLNFLIDESWNPVTEKFGAIAPIYGTLMTSL